MPDGGCPPPPEATVLDLAEARATEADPAFAEVKRAFEQAHNSDAPSTAHRPPARKEEDGWGLHGEAAGRVREALFDIRHTREVLAPIIAEHELPPGIDGALGLIEFELELKVQELAPDD